MFFLELSCFFKHPTDVGNLISGSSDFSKFSLNIWKFTGSRTVEAPLPWGFPGKNTGMGCHFLLQCMKVKSESEVAQSCPTLSDPVDCSLPGSYAHGIFQARVLDWGAIAFSDKES